MAAQALLPLRPAPLPAQLHEGQQRKQLTTQLEQLCGMRAALQETVGGQEKTLQDLQVGRG